jgi:filamentous hemagglutinin
MRWNSEGCPSGADFAVGGGRSVPKALLRTAEEWAAARVALLQASLKPNQGGRVTMAVALVRSPTGGLIRLVSSSERYIRSGVNLMDDEVFVSGNRHAEQNIVDFAKANDYEVLTVAAGRPMCTSCAISVGTSGATFATSRKVELLWLSDSVEIR